MRAIAVKPATKQIDLIDQPEPNIAHPNQVKLRMLEAGVCGTDREICAFEYGTPPAKSDHLVIDNVLRHEAVALLDAALGEISGEAEVLATMGASHTIVMRARTPNHRHDQIADLHSRYCCADSNHLAQ